MLRIHTLVGVVAMALALYAETHLSGEVQKTVLDSSGNPYIVDKEVTIRPDQKLTIKAGCVFLFKPFSGLVVEGQIEVEGTPDAPVVFTSINDQHYYPQSPQPANPFDWNGILLTPQCRKALFRRFILRYSVYGLKAQMSNIVVKDGFFRQNGQFHFTINDKIQPVQDDLSYSYGVDDRGSDRPAKKNVDLRSKPAPSRGKLVLRWGCFGVGAGGLATAAVAGIFSALRWHELNHFEIDPRTDPNWSSRYDKLENGYRKARGVLIFSSIVGAVGAVGFGLSFAW